MLNLFFSCLTMGSLILFFSSSPYFGVFGVLIQAISFALILSVLGCPFFGLLIILIYIGGLLIVFLFSTILSAEGHPNINTSEVFLFWGSINFLFFINNNNNNNNLFNNIFDFNSLSGECNFGELFGILSLFTLSLGLFLLIALISILYISFEHSRANIRYL
uniref:NADH-ubiquinone oxidoreductase chain 6 n=1 Tax=Ophiophthalmus serratus TaxID=2993811 RepID=A0A9E8D083_9ECHI|nr:NADH dehydrogenase subunit 6 [Ophiophthalmus serratus]UZG65888.1 NADH dehydrogenase subunit 6 [Ophiophthalmus serratus]